MAVYISEDFVIDAANMLIEVNILYFDDICAGTTDFNFISDQSQSSSIFESIINCVVRTFFPFWMIQFNSFTAKYYFVAYCLSVISSAIIMCSNKNRMILFLTFLLTMILLSPFVSVNAGSAARYVSVLPFIMYCLIVFIERQNKA